MGDFTDAQARRALLVGQPEKVALRHPGDYLLCMHVVTKELFRVVVPPQGTPPAEIKAFLDRINADGLLQVPHASVQVNAETKLLIPAFWTLPIWGEDAGEGLCESCANHQRSADAPKGSGLCAVLGALTPDRFGCINAWQARPSSEVSVN
jgi:hypothetical protein